MVAEEQQIRFIFETEDWCGGPDADKFEENTVAIAQNINAF